MSKEIKKFIKNDKNSKKYKNRKIAVSFVFGYNMDKDKQIYPLTARIPDL